MHVHVDIDIDIYIYKHIQMCSLEARDFVGVST